MIIKHYFSITLVCVSILAAHMYAADNKTPKLDLDSLFETATLEKPKVPEKGKVNKEDKKNAPSNSEVPYSMATSAVDEAFNAADAVSQAAFENPLGEDDPF